MLSGIDICPQLHGLCVGGAEIEGCVDFALGSGKVSSAQQSNGKVVMVVSVVGIGGGGALKESDSIVALPAGGDCLVVHDFGERQAAGNKGEGGFCFGRILQH